MKRIRLISLMILIISSITMLYAIDDSQVREITLTNGLRVITYEMQSSPVIFSEVTYNVGSKYDSYGETGISHIVEHMMFKGTKRFDKGSIAELISINGGVFNAFTSYDRTCYYELMPKNKIDLAFDIESERMYKCIFDPDEFKSEISVIMEERKMRTENSADGRRREEVNTLLYKKHPKRNPIIGWMSDIERVTRDQAYKHYQTYYTPNNATLVLVGDFNTDEILAKVKNYFGKIPKGPELPEMVFDRVAQDGKKTLEFSHPDIIHEQVQLYFAAPLRFSEDGPALYVAGTILGGRSATSRLHKKLVRELKICKNAGGGLGFSKDPGTFSVRAQLMPEQSLEEVETFLWQEIDSLANYPVVEYDLQKIKNRIAFGELTDDQKPGDVGSKMSLYENYVGWREINTWNDRVADVTQDDIMRVVKTYLNRETLVAVYSRPAEKDSGMVVSSTVKMDKAAEEAPDLVLGEIQVDPDMEISEPGFFAKMFGKPDVRTLYQPTLENIIPPNPVAPRVDSLVLNNGVPVYFVEDHNFPTMYMIGHMGTGRLTENWERPGIRHFTSGVLSRGTENRSYDDIVEEKSFTPYQLQINQGWNAITIQGYSLIKDSDKMLDLLTATLSKPSWPQDQMEEIRPRLVTNAKNFKKTETMKAFYTMYEQVFEGHQYSAPYGGNPEILENLTREDLIQFYDKYYSPEHLRLVAVGDFDKVWLAEKLNATIGSWVKTSKDTWDSFSEQKPIAGKHIHAFNNPEYKQCRVDIAFNPVVGGITRNNPDRDALEILAHILCGSTLTSRMGIKLRDEQGLCYGIKSNLWIRDFGGYWNIRTNVDKEYLARMVQGMLDEIKLIQDEGITDEELLEAKTRKIGLLPLYISTPDDIGSVVFNALRYGRTFDYFDRRKDRLMAVTTADVQRAANKYLDINNYIIGVSGDMAEDALDEFK